MQPDISALSRYQIGRFFRENAPVTQQQCDAMAQQLTGQPITPTSCQGGTSYTVEAGQVVVQFRLPNSPLDMELLQSVEHAYQGFTPRHEYQGQLDELHVYTMNNIGGTCMYLARNELQSNNYHLLQCTINDYARLDTLSRQAKVMANLTAADSSPRPILILNTPDRMARPDPTQLFDKYSSQLQQLREGLPERFHSTLDNIIPQLPELFAEGWPLVPNHTDLLENNIHVDETTGRIVGICDWGDAEVGPFGMSLGGLETMLGIPITTGDFWRYHPNQQALRDRFWTTFYDCLGGAWADEQKRRVEVARLVGLFLANGFARDRHGNIKPATEESEDLRFLGAVVLNR